MICPLCGDPNAYEAAIAVECPRADCANFTKVQAHVEYKRQSASRKLPDLRFGVYDYPDDQCPFFKVADSALSVERMRVFAAQIRFKL